MSGGKTGSYTVPNNVTSIGDNAFYGCTSLTNIVIGNSVTSIGSSAFSSCYSLTSVTIPNSVTNIGDDAFEFCTSLTSVTIPDSVTSIGDHAFAFCTSLTSVTIGTNVTSVGSFAFSSCTNLTSVTIGNSVTSIGSFAFYNCTHLTGVYFQGNAPGLGSFVFDGDNPTVYYLPGTTGWENFAQLTGLPTVLWKPQVQTGDASFGVRTNRFGFNINWASGMVVLVEVCTNLAHPIWSPVGTNTLTGGSSYFSDSHWTNYPARFYRASATITNTAPTGGTTLRVLPGYTLSAYIDTNTGENHVNPQTLMAAGGSPFAGYTWSTSGFPMGTTVAPLTGVFSSNGGTIIAGHYPFTVSVSDGTSTATGSVTLNVTTTTPIPFAILQQYPSGSFALDDANANKPYGASLFAMGGTPPYSWSEDASYSERGDFDLSGLTIGQSSGIVRGTLFNSSSGKTLKFRVIVRDNAGDTSSGPVYTITVR